MNSTSSSNRAVVGVVGVSLALGLTWAGTATAQSAQSSSAGQQASALAQARPGLSRAERREVKRLATRIARKQARRQIRRLAPTLSVASAKTADHATSAETAAKALMADMATTALNAVNAGKVGNLDVGKVNTVVSPGGAAVEVISSDGVTLTASCPAGAPTLRLASTLSGGQFRSFYYDTGGNVGGTGSTNVTPAGNNVPLGAGLGSATLEFRGPDGRVVNAWIGYRDDAPGCSFFGNYLVG